MHPYVQLCSKQQKVFQNKKFANSIQIFDQTKFMIVRRLMNKIYISWSRGAFTICNASIILIDAPCKFQNKKFANSDRIFDQS